MAERKRIRGSGVKYTLPFVGRYSGFWFLVSAAAVVVASVSLSLLFFANLPEGAPQGRFVTVLVVQTVLILLALAGLAVFTTHRLAGPWIGVRRALEDVRDGQLDRQLRLRSSDANLRAVEKAFNEMTAALRAGSADREAAATPRPVA